MLAKAWKWTVNTKVATFINNDKGSIRTWISVFGMVGAVPSFGYFLFTQYESRLALQNIAKISETSQKQSTRDIAKATRDIAMASGRWTQLSAQMLMDEQVARFDDLQARMGVNPSWVATAAEERRELIEYMGWAVKLAHSMDIYTPELLAEKYGYRIEYLLANVFVQDQLLCNSARWAGIVKLGRFTLSQPPPDGTSPYLSRPARLEATAFLACFDKEAKDCHACVEGIMQTRMASGAQLSGAVDVYNFKCKYTQGRIAKLKLAAEDNQPKAVLQ